MTSSARWFLLTLAAFFGVLCLFNTAPAQAQSPVWEATLTVATGDSGILGTTVGCVTSASCSSALTDNSFEVGGAPYLIFRIEYHISGSVGRLRVTFGSSTVNNALKALDFCVGSTAFALSGAGTAQVIWLNTNLGWEVGDEVELSIGSSCAPPYALRVKTSHSTPPCGSEVTDTSVQPTYALVLEPAPSEVIETEYRWIADSTPEEWLEANTLPIQPSGHSFVTPRDKTFARWRNIRPGFKGFEFRLKDTPSVTAQCLWTFSEQTPNTRTPTTDDTTTETPTTNTGGTGTGGGGGGGAPPKDTSSPEEPSDTPCGESDRENLEKFYEATGGENWLEKEYWNSEEPLDQWFGVGTDEDGEVISLRLEENNLSGDMPTKELLCLSELKELALWGNDDLSGEVPEELVWAVERAALRAIAEMLNLNPEWFEDYEDPFDFEDWHEGVTTDDEGRVTELDLPGEIPESIISQFKELREITITTSSDGGCALSPEGSSAFSLFLLTLVVFAVLGRRRARG